MAVEREKGLTIEQATIRHMEGELSSEELVKIIKNNPNRPNYEKLAERAAKMGSVRLR